jgi:hypothetical protein
MPATAINMMVERALPVKLEAGQFDEVTFAIESKNGVATGTVVPVYHGLKLKLTDPNGSLLKRAEFSVVNFAAKEFLIRHDNPAKESEPPRTGTVDHVFAGETVVDFLWYALRGGLEKVMLK